MIKTVKQACRFNPVIQDYRMSQGIENLADLIHDAGDGREFFSRNFVTHGMEQLFREGLLRLSGKSDQAVFELTQAMGGGKTHLIVGTGLAALAGVLIAPAFFANPTFGTDYFILPAFVIVVLGTMGNFAGALIGGLIIGVAEGLGGLVFGPALRQLVSLLLFVVVLLFLPRGLFKGKVT